MEKEYNQENQIVEVIFNSQGATIIENGVSREATTSEIMNWTYRNNPNGYNQSLKLRSYLSKIDKMVSEIDKIQIDHPETDRIVADYVSSMADCHDRLGSLLQESWQLARLFTVSASNTGGDKPEVAISRLRKERETAKWWANEVIIQRVRKTPDIVKYLIERFADREFEPGLESYKDHLIFLNKIVESNNNGEAEGSLFYPWGVMPLDAPSPALRARRRNFALCAALSTSMLETGINVGHSCILAMSVNEKLFYTGIDFSAYRYSGQCFSYLRGVFSGRIHLIPGDSKVEFSRIREEWKSFDFFHLDGGHDSISVDCDLANAVRLAAGNALVLVNDTDRREVSALCDYYIMSGKMEEVKLGTLWEESDQRLLRVRTTTG